VLSLPIQPRLLLPAQPQRVTPVLQVVPALAFMLRNWSLR